MKTKAIPVGLLMTFGLFALAQAQTPGSTPTRNRIVIRSELFSAVQQLLDEQVARGYAVSGISYHSSIRDLNSKGRLEIDLEMPATPGMQQYRALTTELEGSALQKVLNDYGGKGFRLLRQTPIPLELGLVRPRDMFVVVMEKTSALPAHYEYRVIAYRHQSWVRQQINHGRTDGFTELCKHQFGPVIYLVMERTIATSP
jgi:hypothetical protein